MSSDRASTVSRVGAILRTLCAAGAIVAGPSLAHADAAIWQEQTPMVSPPYRGDFGFVFDTTRSRAVVFGGGGVSEADGGQLMLGDTWEWDGSAWTQACTSAPCNTQTPAPRQAFAFAYDSARHKTVIYGGCSDGGCQSASATLDDTWEWDGTSWAQACTSAPCNATTPGPLADVAMAYDSARGKSVLFHTVAKGLVTSPDTWEWDGSAWTLACDGTTACPAPPGRVAYGIAYDAARKQTLIFGGYDGTSSYLDDLWAWDGTRWTQLCTSPECSAKHPVPTLGAAMVYDTTRGSTLLYGGCVDVNCFVVPGIDAWEWNGTAWRDVPASPASPPAPPPSTDARMAYDAQHGRTLVAYGQGLGVDAVMGLYDYQVVGDACLSGATCDTSVCEDGVCCEAACESPCDTCNSSTSPGVCASRVACVTSCDGNHTLRTSDGKGTVDCSPYECEPGGKCKTTCTSPVDCASPSVCNPSGRCVPPPSGQGDGGSGSTGCVVGDGEPPTWWLAAVAIAAVAVVAKRRRGR
jgi:hypothetical protein